MDVKDIGKKVTNPELLEAMKALKDKQEGDTMKTLFEAILKAVLIVPAKFDKEPQPDENGKIVLDKNIKVNFALLTNQSGDKVLPCFTDEETLNASQFDDSFQKILLPYKQLSDMVVNSKGAISGIVINPFTENCCIPAELMIDYHNFSNKNLVQKKLTPGSTVKLRTPRYQPVQMLEECSKLLVKYPVVERAYIQMMEEEKKEDKYLVALDMLGDERPLLSALIPAMKPHAFGIEIAFVKTDNPLGQKVKELAEPFYVRADLVDDADDDAEEGTEE